MDVDLKAWPTNYEAAVQLEVSESENRAPGEAKATEETNPPRHRCSRCRDRSRFNRKVPARLRQFGRGGKSRPAGILRWPELRSQACLRCGPAALQWRWKRHSWPSFNRRSPSSLVPVDRRIFLTVSESAEFSGLPVAFLRRLIASGKIKALKTGAGWRVSRVALEKLSGTLTDMPEELAAEGATRHGGNRRRRQGLADR